MSTWRKAIILIDMNAFFASVEQLDNPNWQNKPVAVTNGSQGTCIITCSYEARAHGIKTGMRLKEAKQLCPDLIQCPANPKRYAQVSRNIMHALHDVTPDIEIFSVDEAFLDVTHCQKLHGSPEHMGYMAKQKVFEASSLLCSVGVSGDKTTAKFAAKLQKPDGFTVILPWEAEQRLQHVPVTELCGIAKGIGKFLAQYGVYTCGDVQKLPISILANRFGNVGRRIWYMCQGKDPGPIHKDVSAPKSMGHGKVMPPNTKDRKVILTYLLHMSEKLCFRLRKHHLQAQHFFIGLRNYEQGWIGDKTKLVQATNDGKLLFRLCVFVLNQNWQRQGISQVQVTALDPKPEALQQDLFLTEEVNHELNQAMDNINIRYGEFTLAPARLIHRSQMPNVIAPAWKPEGHRETLG